MFTTIEAVKEITGKDVTAEDVIMSQHLIESYVGRVEEDITGATDKELLGKAVAYQCAYMKDDPAKTFEQISATQIMQFGQMVTFTGDGVSPFVAPLAVIACKRLSWKGIRSIKTGPLLPNRGRPTEWVRD